MEERRLHKLLAGTALGVFVLGLMLPVLPPGNTVHAADGIPGQPGEVLPGLRQLTPEEIANGARLGQAAPIEESAAPPEFKVKTTETQLGGTVAAKKAEFSDDGELVLPSDATDFKWEVTNQGKKQYFYLTKEGLHLINEDGQDVLYWDVVSFATAERPDGLNRGTDKAGIDVLMVKKVPSDVVQSQYRVEMEMITDVITGQGIKFGGITYESVEQLDIKYVTAPDGKIKTVMGYVGGFSDGNFARLKTLGQRESVDMPVRGAQANPQSLKLAAEGDRMAVDIIEEDGGIHIMYHMTDGGLVTGPLQFYIDQDPQAIVKDMATAMVGGNTIIAYRDGRTGQTKVSMLTKEDKLSDVPVIYDSEITGMGEGKLGVGWEQAGFPVVACILVSGEVRQAVSTKLGEFEQIMSGMLRLGGRKIVEGDFKQSPEGLIATAVVITEKSEKKVIVIKLPGIFDTMPFRGFLPFASNG